MHNFVDPKIQRKNSIMKCHWLFEGVQIVSAAIEYLLNRRKKGFLEINGVSNVRSYAKKAVPGFFRILTKTRILQVYFWTVWLK